MKMLLSNKRGSSINSKNLYKYFVFLFGFFALFSFNVVLAVDSPCGDAAICHTEPSVTISDLATQCPASPQFDCATGTYCDADWVDVHGAAVYCCRACPTIDETECGKKDLQLCCIEPYTGIEYCEDTSLDCRFVEEFSQFICRPPLCGDDNQTCCAYSSSSLACDSGIACNTHFKCAPEETVAPPPLNESVLDLIGYKGPIISDLSELLSPIFRILFYGGLFVGVLGIIYSGYMLISSEGDPGRAKEGKDQLTAAVLGTLFVLISVMILRVVINSVLKLSVGF